jgi:hypothetical protein
MYARPPEINVTVPVGQAFDRVKHILFQPFDLGKWFVIGFGAWLAHLGEQGFHGSYNSGSNFGQQGNVNFQREFARGKDYMLSNLAWIIPLVVVVLVVLLALGVLFLWLNSRGKFMFLHCVALDKAEVEAPWHKFARAGNSLFWFRLVLGLIGSVLTLPLVAVIGIAVIGMVRLGAASAGGIALAAGALLVLIAVALVFAVIKMLTTDFVVPIMFLRGKNCLAGWGELRGLLAAECGNFVLYFLMKIVLSMAIGAMVLMVVLVTCCIAGCFMALPYLGTVLLLPVLVFKRAYSLYFLAQLGRDFDVFPPAAAPSPRVMPPVT